jgi:pyruvate-ferredoxin/flavodoxin oxidoreductase
MFLVRRIEGATLLLNSPYAPHEVWNYLPRSVQDEIIRKQIKVYAIDAYGVAKEKQLGNRINTIMQTCFFAISGVLPRDVAIEKIKESIRKTYGKRGEPVVRQNFAAVDAALAHLHQVSVPSQVTNTVDPPSLVPIGAPEFVQKVTAEIVAGRGDQLPVSAFPFDGLFPSERRNGRNGT